MLSPTQPMPDSRERGQLRRTIFLALMRSCALILVCLLVAVKAQAQLPPCDVEVVVTPITCPNTGDGVISVVALSGGPFDYIWSHDPFLTDPFAIDLGPGQYVVDVSAADCDTVIIVDLTEPFVAPLGTIEVTNISCAGASDGTVTLTLNPGPYTFVWAENPGFTGTQFVDAGPGSYTAIISGGPPPCPSIIAGYLGDPGVEIDGEEVYCPSDPPTLSVVNTWGFQPDLIEWSTGDTGGSIDVIPGTTGTVSVTATNTAIGCVATADIELVELPSPFTVFSAPDTICQFALAIAHTEATDADSLVWRWDADGFSNDTDPTVSFTNIGWQHISLQGFDLFGCGNIPTLDSIFIQEVKPATFSVTQIPCTPTVDIELLSEADSCAFFIGDSLVIDACIDRFRWDFGRYDFYDFTFYATQVNHCDDTTALVVDVRTEPVLFLANAFTPNDDGINDAWPDRVDIPDTGFELVLYDRWGSTVWSTTDPQEQWDGGTTPMGVYPYTMRMRDPCEPTKEIAKTGHLTLFR